MSQLTLPLSPDRKEQALAIVRAGRWRFWPDFGAYLTANWPIYLAFEFGALRLWDRGRTHYGHRSIWEMVRYETAVSEAYSEFKLNDHYTKSVAILFELMNPRCQGMFQFREREAA